MTAQWISWWGFIAITIILLGFAALVLWKVFSDPHALDGLLSEPPGPNGETKASLARFQFLIFTFVIAGLYLLLCIEAGTFIEIPGNVLALLGISGGTFVASKSVTSADQKAKMQSAGQIPTPAAAPVVSRVPPVTPPVTAPPVTPPPDHMP
jgi:hypothetical protein